MKQIPMRTRIAVEQSIARGDTASTTMRAAAVTYEQYRNVADHMNAVSNVEDTLTGRDALCEAARLETARVYGATCPEHRSGAVTTVAHALRLIHDTEGAA